jgi:hypothetical protein
MAARRVLILYNPRAGALGGEREAALLERELARLGCESEVRPTDAAGAVYEQVEADRWEVLVLAGGDGTIHDAINALPPEVLRRTALAFRGLGTVNVLSLATRQPRGADEFANMVAQGKTLDIPLARAGGRRWLLFCEVGFLARAMVLVDHWSASAGMSWLLAGSIARRARKKSLVALAGLWAALTTWGRPLRVELGSESEAAGRQPVAQDLAFSDVLLLRVREYGGRLTMPVSVDLREARFEVLGFRSRWPLTHLMLLGLAAAGWMPRAERWLTARGWLVRAAVSDLRIRTVGRDPARYADAETLREALPLECTIDGSEVLRLVVPGPGKSAERTEP